MKTITLYAILLVVVIFTISVLVFHFEPQPPMGKEVDIGFDRILVESGSSVINVPVTAKFKLYNNSRNEIVIREARPDCHCTAVEYPKQAIAPNDSADITLMYDARKAGPFQSSAVVKLKGSHREELLILRGTITK